MKELPGPDDFSEASVPFRELVTALFHAPDEAILAVNPNGTILIANGHSEDIFGYSKAELKGMQVEDLVPASARNRHVGQRTAYHQNARPRSMSERKTLAALRKDGTEIPVFISLYPVNTTKGQYVLVRVISLTQVRKTELALRESEQRLQSIIEHAVDGIITIDQRGRVQSLNPAAASLFGYQPKEVIGHNIKILMPEPYHSEHDGYIHNYAQSGNRKIIGIGREVIGQRKDGSTFPFYLSVSEVKLSDRTIFTGIVHDLTEQKAVEAKLKRYNEDLEKRVSARTEALGQAMQKMEEEIREREQIEKALVKSEAEARKALEKERELNELKSRFVSMASHEFRTPLATILSSVSLIRRYDTDELLPKREKHIDRIQSNIRLLTGILEDFLSLSKLEEGNISSRPETCQPLDLLRDLLEEMGALKKAHQQFHLESIGKTRSVSLDPRLLTNVCTNLLSNAIKYSQEGSVITIRLQFLADTLKLEITDQGMGIPEDEQQYLFARFFRGREVSNIQGTGLGLSIVKRYVELMGGQISFESASGQGTSFFITLPDQIP
ncbi:MAG: PAS domain S-box protein [Bacteroidota bacterium]